MKDYPEPLDLRRVKVYPLATRRSLSSLERILVDPQQPPSAADAASLNAVRDCVGQVIAARERNASVLLLYGAHLIKNGALRIVNALVEGGWVTHLATNGAGTIHDWELAFLGRTEESVRDNVATGTFGTWDECFSREGWAHFTVLSRSPTRRAVPEAARDALSFALELYRTPERHEVECYRIGYGGYENWMDCIRRGMGGSHGDWWNAMVWKECRWFAAEFFKELGELAGDAEKQCERLAQTYTAIFGALKEAGGREAPDADRLRALSEALKGEREAEAGIEALLFSLDSARGG